MDRIARVVGAKILPSVDHITRIAAAAAAGKDGLSAVTREEVRVYQYVFEVHLVSHRLDFVGVLFLVGLGEPCTPQSLLFSLVRVCESGYQR